MSASPKVWSKFSAKRKDGSVLNLRIIEMPRVPSVQEKVLDLLVTYFVPEEHTMAAAGKSIVYCFCIFYGIGLQKILQNYRLRTWTSAIPQMHRWPAMFLGVELHLRASIQPR